ncbi:unnamed protein product [Nesidiocoris tenuis]|uniref:SAM-dependent MTase RsmB/NOP-type domain-containing protein n=1 Tax=Nesidiocoris tenuis TaxID=355587 RepID=A0A6H5GI41_9HEMI|nr:unnamed protein product [Nesidiocoris tenuis]
MKNLTTLTAAALHSAWLRQVPATLAITGIRGFSFRSSHLRDLKSAKLAGNDSNLFLYKSKCLRLTSRPKSSDSALKVLKYDRVLCDVPCTGDGTLRKNADIWVKWTPGHANNLYGIRLFPQDGNTGAFFVAVLVKKATLPWEAELRVGDDEKPKPRRPQKEKRRDVRGYREDPFVFFKGDEDIWKSMEFENKFHRRQGRLGRKQLRRGIKKKTGLEYEEMLFFDDDSRNLKDLARLNIPCVHVIKGLKLREFIQHVYRSAELENDVVLEKKCFDPRVNV